jgi:hypothetical protein
MITKPIEGLKQIKGEKEPKLKTPQPIAAD